MPFDLSKTDDANVKKAYGYLAESLDSAERREWRDKRDEAWRFYGGDQWTEAEKAQLREANMPDFTINLIAGYVNTKAAIVTDSKPRIKHLPVGGGDDAVNQVLDRGTDVIWDAECVNGLLYDQAVESDLGGMGYMGVAWDKTAGVFGRPIIRHLEPLSVHIDPLVSKSNINAGRFILVANKITASDAKKRYDVDDSDLADMEMAHGDEEDDRVAGKDTARDDYGSEIGTTGSGIDRGTAGRTVWEIECWMFDYEKRKFVVDHSSGQVEPVDGSKVPNVERFNARAKALGDTLMAVEKTMRVVKHMMIVGTKVVEQPTVNPYGADSNQNPLVGVIAMPGIKLRGAYALGRAYLLIGPQRELNKRSIQAIHTVSTQASSNIYAPKGSLTPEDKKKAGKLNQIVEYDPQFGQVQRLGPGTVGMNDTYMLIQETKRNMEMIGALPEPMQGHSDSKSSGRKVLALQEAAMLQSKPTVRAMESVIEQAARVLTQVLIQFAPQEFWIRLFDPNEEQYLLPGLARVVARDASVTMYDVKVAAGSSLPANRMAKMDAIAQIAQALGPNYQDIFAETIARYIDEPEVFDKIRARNQEIAQAQAMAKMQAQAAALGAPPGMPGPGGPPAQIPEGMPPGGSPALPPGA